MCLIAFALGASRRWPLVVAANRDEYFARPTAPLARWQTPAGHTIVSGRDLRAGGTWMGASPGGRMAFLTNVREPSPADAQHLHSRGELVTRWLEGMDESPADLVAAVQAQARQAGQTYAGFNLVVGDARRGDWHWISNRNIDAVGWSLQRLEPGVYGLSNAALDTPWPKTQRLKTALSDALVRADDAEALTQPLWHALSDPQRCAPGNLPATGVPAAVELALSSVFVDFAEQGYGTRSSSVWLATAGSHPTLPGSLQLEERTFAAHGGQPTVATQLMQWPTPAA